MLPDRASGWPGSPAGAEHCEPTLGQRPGQPWRRPGRGWDGGSSAQHTMAPRSVQLHLGQPLTLFPSTALLFLFALHDHDKSGQLDGLEFLHLLMEMGADPPGASYSPILILATQDLNGDGLLNPSELLLPTTKGQPPSPAQADVSDGERLVQRAEQEPEEQSAVALEMPGPLGAADPGMEPSEVPVPTAEQPGAEEGALHSHPGQETAAQPEEDGHWEAGGPKGEVGNAEI
uniref:EF-hand domain-containing protein n=1 Tax=Pelusios castaneus TaxID=367368 RepID=A0A8C8SEX6_9SAUR